MKTLFTLILIVLASTAVQAGNPPTRTCSNLGNTISINSGFVTVTGLRRGENPSQHSFSLEEVNIKRETVTSIPTETIGCSNRTVEFQKITISMKDGSELPNAYNRNAQNGVLTDYFICAESHAWMPRPGTPCN